MCDSDRAKIDFYSNTSDSVNVNVAIDAGE